MGNLYHLVRVQGVEGREFNTMCKEPAVTSDPRFRAGRKLVTSSNPNAAIAMFATLVEEAEAKYGESSVEAAACYYEYGNSIIRAGAEAGVSEQEPLVKSGDAAASAAEKRMLASKVKSESSS